MNSEVNFEDVNVDLKLGKVFETNLYNLAVGNVYITLNNLFI